MPETHDFIEFKYLKNRMIDFGNGVMYDIPYRTEPAPVPGSEQYKTIPVFNLNVIHRIELQSETPDVPERIEGESDRAYQELVDEAYESVRERRKSNKEIRKRVAAFVASGTIEVVRDSAKEARHNAPKVKSEEPARKPKDEKPKPEDAK